MAETTPQKQQASARLLQVGVDEDHLDGSAYPEGVSRTPGSPTKHGGRTMWTKADDDSDAMNGASAVGVSGTSGESESEPVIKQVTHTDSLAAPVYGTSAQPTSFKRKGGGVDGRGAGAPSGGGGGGILGALLCCIPARKEDRNDERLYTTPTAALAAHRTVPEAQAMHSGDPFLPPATREDRKKPCLVLDLDETLVHSSFKPVPNPDFVIPVEIDGTVTDVYVLKRPWVDYFMEEVSKRYEVVVFTASLAKYADPLLDLLDKGKTISHRLFRESCYLYQGNYVKDLTSLGRPMCSTVIIDNSPHSYAFQPQNALPVSSFIDDPRDNDLLDMLPYLDELAGVDDVAATLVENCGFVPRRSFFSRGLPVPHERQYR